MAPAALSVDRHFRDALDAQFPPLGTASTKWLFGDAALKLFNAQSGRAAVAAAQAQFPQKLEWNEVSHRQETYGEERQLTSEKTPRTFRERVRDAMQRRIGKGKALTVKQVAHAVGCSDGTIENLMGGGTSEPSSRVLRELMMFFDDSFANEIWGCDGFVIVRMNHQKAAAVRKIMEAQAELRRLG
jgi:hypothetical protein